MQWLRMQLTVRWLFGLALALATAHMATAAQRSSTTPAQRVGGDDALVKPVPAANSSLMEVWWTGLEKEEPEASRALLNFAGRPNEAVPFLREKLKPLTVDAERVYVLLAKLGSADEDVWKPAFEELEYFDPRLAIDLKTLMHEMVDSPRRERMVAVMSGRPAAQLEGRRIELREVPGGGHNFASTPGGSWWADQDVSRINSNPRSSTKTKWTRAVRAIALLEHIGTPDAIAILKALSGGHPLAQPTRESMEALERVGGKGR
jgi:hypothetical protein